MNNISTQTPKNLCEILPKQRHGEVQAWELEHAWMHAWEHEVQVWEAAPSIRFSANVQIYFYGVFLRFCNRIWDGRHDVMTRNICHDVLYMS